MALFDKFTYAETSGSSNSVVERIAHNLNHLLNTRRDFDAWLPSFGLSDIQGRPLSPELLQDLMAELDENITRYEPRLEQVCIRPEEPTHAAQLCFRIDCYIAQQPHSFCVVLDRSSASRTL